MADKHPYISGTGGITGAINHFRKAFPTKVNAETLKKLGIAPNNESYVINILRFIGVIDADGNRTSQAAGVFSKHELGEFQESFGQLVKTAYADLFEMHGEGAWTLETNKLISFFRGSDKTSDLVGRRQATTFQVLATFAGHGEIPSPKISQNSKSATEKPHKLGKTTSKDKPSPNPPTPIAKAPAGGTSSLDFGLTVRIEVNLPPAGDQETYDRIFRSIRENLLKW